MSPEQISNQMNKISAKYSKEDIRKISEKFSRDGIVIVRDLIPADIYKLIEEEILLLLDECNERVDLTLKTTDNTPRKMNIVSHSNMLEKSNVIKQVYEDDNLKSFLELIAKEKMISYISDDEGLFIARQGNAGDTHGWHWGDYSFALIYVVKTPPVEVGGMLQCVPHTNWNKEDARINKYLCENKIDTYGFTSGDIYFLKTDTTLHRTVPLKKETTRIILNMTWGTEADKTRHMSAEKDTWWQDSKVETAEAI